MKLHRQQLRVQANQMLRPQDRQRVAPRPVQALAQQRLRVDPRWSSRKFGSTADEFCGPDVGD